MNIDERLRALTSGAELLLHESQEHTRQLEMDGEHIRALVRVAELHHERLLRLEKESPGA